MVEESGLDEWWIVTAFWLRDPARFMPDKPGQPLQKPTIMNLLKLEQYHHAV